MVLGTQTGKSGTSQFPVRVWRRGRSGRGRDKVFNRLGQGRGHQRRHGECLPSRILAILRKRTSEKAWGRMDGVATTGKQSCSMLPAFEPGEQFIDHFGRLKEFDQCSGQPPYRDSKELMKHVIYLLTER